jgi:hypothetical protein
MKWIFVAVASATLWACAPAAAPTLYDDGDQGAPDCPSPSTFGGQPGVPGSACTDAAADCSPVCCLCGSGTDSYWASECSDDVCQNDSVACADAFNADGSLCTQ